MPTAKYTEDNRGQSRGEYLTTPYKPKRFQLQGLRAVISNGRRKSACRGGLGKDRTKGEKEKNPHDKKTREKKAAAATKTERVATAQ